MSTHYPWFYIPAFTPSKSDGTKYILYIWITEVFSLLVSIFSFLKKKNYLFINSANDSFGILSTRFMICRFHRTSSIRRQHSRYRRIHETAGCGHRISTYSTLPSSSKKLIELLIFMNALFFSSGFNHDIFVGSYIWTRSRWQKNDNKPPKGLNSTIIEVMWSFNKTSQAFKMQRFVLNS